MSDATITHFGTRKEWTERCKQRALVYLEAGKVSDAVTQMMHDLNKNPLTRISSGSLLHELGVTVIGRGDVEEARSYIEGFK